MNKNIENLKEMNNNLEDYRDLKISVPILIDTLNFIIPLLEDFEKRLTELEKFKNNTLEYYEINETGGVNNIKIGGTDPD